VGHDIGVHTALAAHLLPMERHRLATAAHGPGRVLKRPAIRTALDDETALLEGIEERLRLLGGLRQRQVRRSLEAQTTDTNNDGACPEPASRTPAARGKSPAGRPWRKSPLHSGRVASRLAALGATRGFTTGCWRGRRTAAPARVVPRLLGIRSSGYVVHRRGGTPPSRPHTPWRRAPLAPRWRPFGRGATRSFTTGSQPRPPDGCPELRKREPPVPSLQERFALRCKDGHANGRATKPLVAGRLRRRAMQQWS